MTQTAAVVGTAQYLSPEQARGEKVDARSDLYSTGCLLYELLDRPAAVRRRLPVLGGLPARPRGGRARRRTHDPELPAELDAIVMKSLAKKVEDRYQSAAEMRADIQRYLAGQPVDAPTAVAPRRRCRRRPPSRRRSSGRSRRRRGPRRSAASGAGRWSCSASWWSWRCWPAASPRLPALRLGRREATVPAGHRT